MRDKGLNLFDECAAGMCISELSGRRVYSSSWEHSKIYTPDTKANSQIDRAPTEINKNGAVIKVRILVDRGIL